MACASTTFDKRENGVRGMDVMPVSRRDTVRKPNGRQKVPAVHPPAEAG